MKEQKHLPNTVLGMLVTRGNFAACVPYLASSSFKQEGQSRKAAQIRVAVAAQ